MNQIPTYAPAMIPVSVLARDYKPLHAPKRCDKLNPQSLDASRCFSGRGDREPKKHTVSGVSLNIQVNTFVQRA